jgi:ribosomal protein S18 acetylase RimI-like enzyme
VTSPAVVHDVVIRPATLDDSEAVADVYLAAFQATYDFGLAHSDADVRRWIADGLIPGRETWVAEAEGQVVAMLALDDAGIDQLYVLPTAQGNGIGRALVDLAKARRPEGLQLYTFQVNERARRFYERNGFVVAALGDGSGNEEGQPDVLYHWAPDPT